MSSSCRRTSLARAKPPIDSAVLAGTVKKVNRMIAKAAFQDLLDAIKKNGGNCNYGEYTQTINRYHELGHCWLKRRHLTYLMESHNKHLATCCNNNNNVIVIPDKVIENSDDVSSLTDEIAVSNSGGRPKGSTCDAKNNYKNMLNKAITDAAILFKLEKEAAENKKQQVKKGVLQKIVKTIEMERGIPDNTIPVKTIRNRVLRNNVTACKKSSLSPLMNVEKIIVEYCVRLARIGNALNKDQVMSLAEDVIHGTQAATKLAEYKTKRQITDIYHEQFENQRKVRVGEGWYKNFMRRNKDKIKRQRLKVKDRQRLTYCTYPNFQIMYETVYEDMVNCGIAIKMDEEVLVNLKGEIIYNKQESDGLPTHYLMTNPNLIVFVDETGSNTNQKSDPLRGNEKRIVPINGDGFGLAGAVNDNHFTFLCFQSGTGEPIMCAIIFKSERKNGELPDCWKTGIDIRKLRDEEVLPESQQLIAQLYMQTETVGNGALSGGPVCNFNGKEIKCYCTCSPNASITSTILTCLLKEIDQHNVFDRQNGTKPLLLLDGHHSRMDLEFLEYINQPGNEWCVCIGVPYGTHLWQVADSSQINGKFKIELTKEKCEYMKYKQNNNGLLVTDIVPIVKGAFERSFANVGNTKKAIAERGWGPALNYRLLLDDRLSQRPSDAPTNQPSTASNKISVSEDAGTMSFTVNLQEGSFAAMTDVLLDQRNQDKGREKSIREKMVIMKNKQQHIELIKNLPKISSGQLMSNGWLRMDATVRDNKRKRKEDEDANKMVQQQKRQKVLQQQQERYQAAINKCLVTKQTLTMADFTALVKQASEKGDLPVTKGRDGIIQQLQERFHRLSRYLPSLSCDNVMQHISNQPATKKKNITKRTHNPEYTISDFADCGTNGTEISHTATSSTMEIQNVSEDVASMLLEFANASTVFGL
jgi:hypothetical protein